MGEYVVEKGKHGSYQSRKYAGQFKFFRKKENAIAYARQLTRQGHSANVDYMQGSGQAPVKRFEPTKKQVQEGIKKKRSIARKRRSSNSYGNIFGGRSRGGLFY